MVSNATVTANSAEDGMRLDLFIMAHFPGASRSQVRDALLRGDVLLGGRKAGKGAKIRAGDIVTVAALPEAPDNHVRPDPSVAPRIVYADADLVAADKPAGMPVQPLSADEGGTLAGGMVALYPALADVGDEPLIAGAVHRIDAGTSGLVIFALTAQSFSGMRRQFANREVAKKYLALVEGHVARGGAIACELAHTPRLGFCRMAEYAALPAPDRARARPLFAETRFRPLRQIGGRALLEVSIETGVTHQIRAQLALSGHPIVGDRTYGGGDASGLAPENCFCLHSLSARFRHPVSGEWMDIATRPPAWARQIQPHAQGQRNGN